jgi:hypothetical protein
LKYLASMGDTVKELTIPKPDVVFGLFINRSSLESEFFTNQTPSIFSLDHRRICPLLSMAELLDYLVVLLEKASAFQRLLLNAKVIMGHSISPKIKFWEHCDVCLRLRMSPNAKWTKRFLYYLLALSTLVTGLSFGLVGLVGLRKTYHPYGLSYLYEAPYLCYSCRRLSPFQCTRLH